MSEKTEAPTPKKKRQALAEGDTGASAAFTQSWGFVVALALVPALVDRAAASGSSSVREAIARVGRGAVTVTSDDAVRTLGGVVSLTAPLLAAVALVAVVVGGVQSGGVVTFGRLAPRIERLDPLRGFAGLFSSTRAFAVLRALVAAAAVGFLAWNQMRDHARDLVALTGRTALVGSVVGAVAMHVARAAAAVFVVLGAFDLLVSRRAWTKRLRMTKEEVKREHKESEGDPEVRAARQRAHQEALAQVAAHAVKGATVVVVNPTHLACALRYDEGEGDEAPVVLASGEGAVAQAMVRAARDYGVPVVENVPLARALIELESGAAIPEALYEAVAEVLREIMAQATGDDGG
ncbi:MAG: EscU/YscU/HrcU family type III secretion system export apparatus switch protein [Polyangiaceae bacterium]